MQDIRRTSDIRRFVEQRHERWGIYGFSVLEVPDGDFEQFVRMRPIVAARRQRLARMDLAAVPPENGVTPAVCQRQGRFRGLRGQGYRFTLGAECERTVGSGGDVDDIRRVVA